MPPHPDRNDEPAERAPKRRRVAQACTPCRQRKSRCNGARPICSACAELKHRCSYLGPDDVRHIAVGQGYLKTLEQRLSQLEAAVTTNQTAGHVQTDSPSRASQTNFERAFDYESNEGSEPQTTSSRDPTDGMAHFIFAEEEDVGYFGPSSNIYFTRDISNALQRILWTIEAGGGQVASIPHLDRGVLAISRPPSPSPVADRTTTGTPGQRLRSTQTGPDSRESDAYYLPPEAQVRELLGKYFANTGELFPYIHPTSFMQTYQEVLQDRRPVRRTWLALLNIILAISVSTDISAEETDPVQRQQRAHHFYNRATKLGGGSTATHASLETVQYLLVTSQYLQGTSTSSQTWAMHGLAVKAAMQLGLHSTQALRRYPPLEQEMGKRTWFGCVVLDRTLSMTFGRPPTIPESFLKNLQLAVPYETSGEPRNGTHSHYSTGFFNATITLYRILGDAIQLLYGDNLGSDQHQQTYQMLIDVLHLEERLETWTRNLPPDMNVIQASPATPDGPYKLGIILRLRYLNTRSLIHRVVVSSMLRTVGSAELQAPSSPSLDLARKASLETCVSSSLEVISRIHYATSEDSPRVKALGAWWFSLYYTVDAALGLFAASMICHVHAHMASPDTSSAEDRKSAIQQAIETLRRLDRGNRIVDRCTDCLKRLVQALAQLSTTPVNNNGTANIPGGFTPFVSAAPLSPTLWSSNEATATDGQPSFLDLDSLFDNNFMYGIDEARAKP